MLATISGAVAFAPRAIVKMQAPATLSSPTETTHGRVGMLAAAGFLVQEFWHPLFTADGGPAIEQIPKLPPPLWFGMTLAIGICETIRIQKGWSNPYEGMENVQGLKPDYYPGDLGFDPLGLRPEDPAELRTMQEKELSHSR